MVKCLNCDNILKVKLTPFVFYVLWKSSGLHQLPTNEIRDYNTNTTEETNIHMITTIFCTLKEIIIEDYTTVPLPKRVLKKESNFRSVMCVLLQTKYDYVLARKIVARYKS